MSTTRPKRHVVWNTDEMRFLGRRVARALMRGGINPLDSHPSAVEARMIDILQDAILCLPDNRQRDIKHVGQVSWLRPIMSEMVLASRGESDKFPPTILDDFKPSTTEPHYAASNLLLPMGDPEYTIPPGFSLVHETEWVDLNRRITRIERRSRRMAIAWTQMSESLTALTELIMEAVPHLTPQDEASELTDHHPMRKEQMPLIVVAGVHRRDQRHIQDKIGERAELVFIDHNTKKPEQIGECDWIIMPTWAPSIWRDAVKRKYQDKYSMTHGGQSHIVKEIERITKTPTTNGHIKPHRSPADRGD